MALRSAACRLAAAPGRGAITRPRRSRPRLVRVAAKTARRARLEAREASGAKAPTGCSPASGMKRAGCRDRDGIEAFSAPRRPAAEDPCPAPDEGWARHLHICGNPSGAARPDLRAAQDERRARAGLRRGQTSRADVAQTSGRQAIRARRLLPAATGGRLRSARSCPRATCASSRTTARRRPGRSGTSRSSRSRSLL